MSKATSLAKLLATTGALMLPLLASAAEDRSCWLRDAASPAPNVIHALCMQGKVYTSQDSGASWTGRETGSDQDLRAIAFSDTTHGLVVGDKGAMYGTNDGKKWEKRNPGTSQNLLTVFTMGAEAWVGGFGGVILHSPDNGKTWQQQPTGTTQAIEDIFFYDAQHGWAVGWAGTIMRTSDGGKKWEAVVSKAANWSLTAVKFKDLKNGWIAGFAGQLLRTEDGGATWTVQPAPFKGWLTSVAYDQAGRTWITADDQFLLSEDGAKFRSLPTDTLLYMRQLVPVGKDLWAVGQLGLLRLAGNGTDWKPITTLVVGSAATMNTPTEDEAKPQAN
jgi:photosystem II stability/assembly factor-like uncharacterized protein